MTALLDTNILIRHLTNDPPKMAARATAFLTDADQLLLADLIVAETIYVLEYVYDVPAHRVAELMRSIITFPTIHTTDENLLLRSIEVYEIHGIDYAEAYLVASAERSGVEHIVSFDRTLDRVPTVTRIEP